MAKHAAPHTDFDGTPLPLVHFPGLFVPGGLTPCGLPFAERGWDGELRTVVASAINPALVNCEACYATEDIKHRQDYAHGQHSAMKENEVYLADLLQGKVYATAPPSTPGEPSGSASVDVRVWNDDAGMEHISGDGTELWFRRTQAIEDFNLTLKEGGLFG